MTTEEAEEARSAAQAEAEEQEEIEEREESEALLRAEVSEALAHYASAPCADRFERCATLCELLYSIAFDAAQHRADGRLVDAEARETECSRILDCLEPAEVPIGESVELDGQSDALGSEKRPFAEVWAEAKRLYSMPVESATPEAEEPEAFDELFDGSAAAEELGELEPSEAEEAEARAYEQEQARRQAETEEQA